MLPIEVPVLRHGCRKHLGGEHGEPRLELLLGETGLDAPHDVEPPPRALFQPGCFSIENAGSTDRHGNIEFASDVYAVKARGADSDDLKDVIVQGERAADGALFTAEMLLPKAEA